MNFFNFKRVPEDISPSEEQFNVAKQEMDLAKNIAKREKAKAIISGETGKLRESTMSPKARFALGKNLGQAVVAARPVSFTAEQQMLQQMFGGGSKIWGTNNQPVRINNDLNSSRSDPWDETGSMFGFGPFGERSGMF